MNKDFTMTVRKNEKTGAMRMLLFVACLVLHVSCFFSCTSIDCPVQNTVYTVYNLQKANGSTDTLKDTMYVFTFRSDGLDTTLYNAGIGLTTFTLPISYSNPEDTLYFLLRNDPILTLDTVWIKKEDYPHFESVDCSAAFFHTITAVRSTHNGIDSIVINKREVNYDATTEHFHIYFKTHD